MLALMLLALAQTSPLITEDDYPVGAILLGLEGTVAVQLNVDPSGKVVECIVEQSSNSPLLDSQTCQIFLKRARFQPFRGSSGQAVSGTTKSRITWRIAGNSLPIAPWAFRLGVLLTPRGEQEVCSLQGGGALKRTNQGNVHPCAELRGAYSVPPDLSQAMLGKKTVLVFDRQFVPRLAKTINSPRDLQRYKLLGREVVVVKIGGNGVVLECKRKAAEGPFLPSPDACETLVRRQFKIPAGTALPLVATASLSLYSLR